MNNLIIALVGCSGSGKTTIRNHIEETLSLQRVVTMTTRSPRDGEVPGEDYLFKTREEGYRMLDDGELLEHVEYSGNLYGLPKRALDIERPCVVIVERQGLLALKRCYPERTRAVLVLPPSLEELERRLWASGRKPEHVSDRLKTAADEMRVDMGLFDYILVNDDLKISMWLLAKYISQELALT